MSEKEKKEQIVTINGTDFKESDLTEEEIESVNHVADLDGKIARAKFNLRQMEGGRIFHMEKLETSIKKKKDVAA